MRFFLAALTLPLALASPCPFSGTPVLLPPRHLAQDRNLRHSLNRLTATLDSAVAGTINPGFRGNDTSFSIILTDASETLWEYHHTATATVQGTKKVDSNSQFRIASITKMLTDLLLLRLGLDLDEKITTYLPLLAGGKKKGRLEWEAVTLRDLGSHMSGVEEQYGYPEDYSESTRKFWTGLGLPALPREDYPICDVTGMGNSTNRCTMDCKLCPRSLILSRSNLLIMDEK